MNSEEPIIGKTEIGVRAEALIENRSMNRDRSILLSVEVQMR
jgi:hypothetical protein